VRTFCRTLRDRNPLRYDLPAGLLDFPVEQRLGLDDPGPSLRLEQRLGRHGAVVDFLEEEHPQLEALALVVVVDLREDGRVEALEDLQTGGLDRGVETGPVDLAGDRVFEQREDRVLQQPQRGALLVELGLVALHLGQES
jgi:hypothetical protein